MNYNAYAQMMQYGQALPPAYNSPYQQPIQQQPMGQQIPSQGFQNAPQQSEIANSGIIWVNNENEANSYLVVPNSAVALWDANSPFIYLKQADASGKPTLKKYRLTEEIQGSAPVSAASNEYALKADLQTLKTQIEELSAKYNELTKEGA